MTVTELFIEYNDSILFFLLKNGLTRQDAEDVAQNMWTKTCNRDLTQIKNTKAFLYELARNAASDLASKQNKRYEEINGEELCELCDTESVRHWFRNEDSGKLNERMVIAVYLAAYRKTSFGATFLNLIEDQMAGLTQNKMAKKYKVRQSTISRELTQWYKYVKEELPIE